jgi:excisionase family DNA binding protein
MTTTPTTSSDAARSTTSARPLLITVAQAAEALSLSRSLIYQLIWSEQLVPIHIGRSVRFSMQQIEQFVAQRSADR